MPFFIYKYISKSFLKAIALFASLFFIIIFLLQLTLNLKSQKNFDFISILQITCLETPQFLIDIFPFIILFSSYYCLRLLNNNKEIEVFKSIGMSIYNIITPLIIIGLVVSVFIMFILSSVSVFSLNYLNTIKNKNTNQSQQILIKNFDIWMIDTINNSSQNILLAQNSLLNKNTLKDVLFFQIKDNTLTNIIFAKTSEIKNKTLALNKVIIKNTENQFVEEIESLNVDFNIKLNAFNNINNQPNQILFWKLPSFINYAKTTAVNFVQYEIYFYNLITLPLFFLIMILISVIFAIKQSRNQNNIFLAIGMICCGFFVYLILNIIVSFTTSGFVSSVFTIVFSKLLLLALFINILFHKEKL